MGGTRVAVAVAAALILGLFLGYVYAANISGPSTTTILSVKTSAVTVTTTFTTTARMLETSVVERTSVSTSITTKTVVKPYPRTLIDALGRTVRIEERPRRIVVLSPAITETVFTLGAGRLVVGVDAVSDYPPIVVKLRSNGSIANVGGYWWSYIKVEKIVELKPDLVIAEVGAHAKLREVFEEKGLNVLYVRGGAAKSIRDVKQDILLIGAALGYDSRARELVSMIDSTVREITSRLAAHNASRVKVYVEVGSWQGQLWTAGGDTFINDVLSKAGGVNVFSKYSGYPQISYEDVVAANPDVIIVPASHMGAEEASKIISRLASRPGWSSIRAVEDKQVYVLLNGAADSLLRPGPRVIEALKMLASILHPEIFGEYGGGDVAHMSVGGINAYVIPVVTVV